MERRRTWCVSETCSIPQILPADGIDVRRTRSNGDAFLNLNQTFCSSPNLQSAISRSGWKRFNTVLHEAATSEHSICIGRLLRAVSFGVMVPSSAGFMLDKHGPLTDMPSNFCTMSGCQLKAQPRSPCTVWSSKCAFPWLKPKHLKFFTLAKHRKPFIPSNHHSFLVHPSPVEGVTDSFLDTEIQK